MPSLSAIPASHASVGPYRPSAIVTPSAPSTGMVPSSTWAVLEQRRMNVRGGLETEGQADGSWPLAGRLSGSGLDRGQRHRIDDVVHQGTAAEVVHGLGQALQHRADAHHLSAALDSFVRRVASI